MASCECVLRLEFVGEEEDVVDSNRKDEEGKNFSDDESCPDSEEGEESDRSRNREENEEDANEA